MNLVYSVNAFASSCGCLFRPGKVWRETYSSVGVVLLRLLCEPTVLVSAVDHAAVHGYCFVEYGI